MKIASFCKISDSLESVKDNVINDLRIINYKTCNKNRLLSKRYYSIPGTENIRFGVDGDDFLNNMVSVIVESTVRTNKDERRLRRLTFR